MLRELWAWLGAPGPGLDPVAMFLQGQSIAQVAAQLGYSQADMIAGQRWVESELRAAILDLQSQLDAAEQQAKARSKMY